MSDLNELLEYLENAIDPEHIENTIEFNKKCLNFEKVDRLSVKVNFSRTKFQSYPYAEAYEDMEKMLYNELLGCVNCIEVKDDSLPAIRANYGVGIVPSLFGLKQMIINGNMPWVEPLKNEKKIEALIQKGIPDINSALGDKVFKTHAYYKEILSDYPMCNKYIPIYHPDMQGPLDIAHLIWGSDIYLALYDTPELVDGFLKLITETYIKLMMQIKNEINDETGDFHFQWGLLYKGRITLRNDSSVNLSRDMYIEFVKKYDRQILKAFGNGSMHFCGRADHLVFEMADTDGVTGMNFGYMSNVQFGQDFLELVYDKFSECKIPVIGYELTQDEYGKFDKGRFRTGITLKTTVKTKEEALAFLSAINPIKKK